MVPLNGESLLHFRDRVLSDRNLEQRQMIYQNPKRKATEEGRRKQKDDYEVAFIKKQQRKERHIAMQFNHQSEKLDSIERKIIKSQELGYARLNEIKERMREEQEQLYRQRAEILKSGVFHSTENLLLITIFLAITSPLWLMVVFIKNIYSRARGRYSLA